jgi:serine-type D-Ala-D-Ala carboxypeptidase/endopeptidase
MTSRTSLPICLCITALSAVAAARPMRADDKDLASQVERLAQPLVDNGAVVGLAIGVLDKGQRRTFGFGRIAADRDERPTADTLYEIGSITKVFTGLLLADAVERKKVSLDDPVQKYLPDDVVLRTVGGTPITLVDLSTHFSGLPRMPDNFAPADPNNPYADYNEQRMFAFLKSHEPTRAPGEEMEYSNLAVGLLGHLLARHAKSTYPRLVEERILQPLNMKRTRIALSDDDKASLAPGHNVDGTPVANWDLDALAGAGALRSTVNDMLSFLAAQLDPASTRLEAAIRASHEPRRAAGGMPGQVALGWMIAGDGQTWWHNGGTGGYHSYAAFDPKENRAVVVLCNTSSDVVDQLGANVMLALAGQSIPPPPAGRKVAHVDAKVLAQYPGQYELAPGIVLTVTLDGDKLSAQLTGQDKFRIYPESDEKFFYRIVDAQIVFVKNDSGEVEKLVLHQNGQQIPGKRLEGD